MHLHPEDEIILEYSAGNLEPAISLCVSAHLEHCELCRDKLAKLDQEFKIGGNYIYYLSTPPFLYETIPACLAAYNLNDESDGWKS